MTIASPRRFGLILLLLATRLPTWGADFEVKAGGVVVTLPGPADDFREAGDKLRTTFFELLVPSNNRLLSAYLPAKTFELLAGGSQAADLDVYAMVEVPRRAEYADCTPEAFQQVLKGLEPSLGRFDAKKADDLEQELNLRLKALGTKPVEIGPPEMLGGVFQKTDAAGFAMLTAYKQGDRSVTMAGGLAVLRVRQRPLFAYLYRKLDFPETVSRLGKDLEAWCDAALHKNR